MSTARGGGAAKPDRAKLDRATLDRAILAAHAGRDTPRLASLYARAARACQGRNDEAFWLTQAYILALDAGCDDATALHERLVALGAER